MKTVKTAPLNPWERNELCGMQRRGCRIRNELKMKDYGNNERTM